MNASAIEHDARRIFTAALESVHPARALNRPDILEAVGRAVDDASRVVVFALGKASADMLKPILRDLGRSVHSGLLVVPVSYGVEARPRWLPEQVDLAYGGHPHPTEGSLNAGQRAIRLVDPLRKRDLTIALLSGGGSAMLDTYAAGISLEEAASVNRQLLASGADISEINCVRKHISEVKGGRLASRAFPARTIVLAISDVPGDDTAVIASGPFSADSSTFDDALEIIGRRAIDLPPSVRTHLERGVRGEVAESVKPGDERLDRVEYHIVASNDIAVSAAAAEARSLGYNVALAPALSGDVREASRSFADLVRSASSRTCVISGGETTVTLGERPGLGGRNQAFGLAAALHLHDAPGEWCILAGGTDGIDGVTDAAGTIIASGDLSSEGLRNEASDHLRRHDSHPFLKRHELLLMTGPTGTNVMDLAIGLRP